MVDVKPVRTKNEERIAIALGMQQSAERSRDKAEKGLRAAQADNVSLREQLAEAQATIAKAAQMIGDHRGDLTGVALDVWTLLSAPSSTPEPTGHWSNGDPVHLIVDGKGGRKVAPNLNGATWVKPYDPLARYAEHDRCQRGGGTCSCGDSFPAPSSTGGGDKPETVCICGSTRFRAEIAEANRSLTMQGYMVLAPGVFGHDGDPLTDDDKLRLDRLHFSKIDASDRVHVVNPGGYIGESTRREIEYAKAHGKPITYRHESSTGGGDA